MPDQGKTPLDDERYVSLETFKKDGTGVKTPVWAAPLDGALVLMSEGGAYKVKRVRNDPRARVASCDMRGGTIGTWYDATARILEDAAHIDRVQAALAKKYGWQYAIGTFFSRLAGKKKTRAYIELRLTAGSSG